MDTRSETVKNKVFSLLRDWCNALLCLQVDLPGNAALDGAILRVFRGKQVGEAAETFHLTPGFMAKEYSILPDADGCFGIRITADGEETGE